MTNKEVRTAKVGCSYCFALDQASIHAHKQHDFHTTTCGLTWANRIGFMLSGLVPCAVKSAVCKMAVCLI